MKVELKVSIASNVATMSTCPKVFENQCGILYRQS